MHGSAIDHYKNYLQYSFRIFLAGVPSLLVTHDDDRLSFLRLAPFQVLYK